MNSLGPGRKHLFLKKITIFCLLFSGEYIYTPCSQNWGIDISHGNKQINIEFCVCVCIRCAAVLLLGTDTYEVIGGRRRGGCGG
jgi:hypothetical protein